MAVVEVENLGKKYRLRKAHGPGREAAYRTLRETLTNAGRDLLRGIARPAARREEYWALRDVSFGLEAGEVLGVIGRNGAGKSTLLKLLSRITDPSEGRFRMRGRVGSLLEVGAGFHPELTGRENIYLNAALLGMTRPEARARFDDIVAFAEVERFLDTPVKRYSSGMYVRLAFSVAAHLEPEILLVDEVLAVGDANFQKRCLGKIKEVSSQGGRTVLFVSHNMASISALCTRGLVLDKGRVTFMGDVNDAVGRYLAEAAKGRFEANAKDGPGIEYAEVDADALARGDLRIRIGISSPKPFRPNVGAVVASAIGAPIFGTNLKTHPPAGGVRRMDTGEVVLEVPDLPLHSGSYTASLWLSDMELGPIEHQPDALSFDFVAPRFIPELPPVSVIGPVSIQANWAMEPARQ